MPVHFTETDQMMIDKASNVRIRDVDVINVYIDLEPVPFHRGFYSVDMTFFFEVELDVFMAPAAMPACIKGCVIYDKKVILYGSEGNVKLFCSDYAMDDPDTQSLPSKNLPKACVQVAKPIGLSAKLKEHKGCCSPCCRIPHCICTRFGGNFATDCSEKKVFVTLGVFTIVQIERNVQMLIPTYDFCIPEKECITSSDDPCEMFSRIDFPTDEFFPPKVSEMEEDHIGCGGGCGCS